MTCPRITRAIDASPFQPSVKYTLGMLTSHINSWKDPETRRPDHTRPATLEVFDSVATLMATTRQSKPTVRLHLLKLQGFVPIHGRPKAKWPRDEARAVLEVIVKPRQHYATRYRLNLERLEALQGSKTFPSDLNKNQQLGQRQGSNHQPRDGDPEVKVSPSRGKVSLPESFPSVPQIKNKQLAPARETRNGEDIPTYTPAPDRLDLPEGFLARCERAFPALDIEIERDALLGHCRRRDIWNECWLSALWAWLVEAKARQERGERTATQAHRARSPRRATARPWPATPAAGDPPLPRVTCSWAGCGEPPCPHSQACTTHGCCYDCAEERAQRRAEREAVTPPAPSGGLLTCWFPSCPELPCPHAPDYEPFCVEHGVCEVCNAAIAAANAHDAELAAAEASNQASAEAIGVQPSTGDSDVKAAGNPAVTTAGSPDGEPTDAGNPAEDIPKPARNPVPEPPAAEREEAETVPLAAVMSVATAVAASHTLPTSNPRAGPLGHTPPWRRVDGGLGDDGPRLEQDPGYLARMRDRRALLRQQAERLRQQEAERLQAAPVAAD